MKKIMIVFFVLALFSLTSVYANENINSYADISNQYIADSTDDVGISYDDVSIMAEEDNGEIEDEGKYLEISETFYPGWHWEVSSDSHGVDLVSQYNHVEDPFPGFRLVGGPVTTNFKFQIIDEDYYVRLVLLSPRGDIEDQHIYIDRKMPVDTPSVENNTQNNTSEEDVNPELIEITNPNDDILINYDSHIDSDNATPVEQINRTQNNILQENTSTQNNSSIMENNTQSPNDTSNNSLLMENNTQSPNGISNNISVMENTGNPLFALLLSCILIPMGIYRKRK